MLHFAVVELSEFATILGVISGMLVGFYGITKFILKLGQTDKEADRNERKELTKAISAMAKSNEKIASEMRDGNRKAEIRNGHLGEQNVQITQLVIDSQKKTLDAIKNIKVQHVQNQHVDVQDVSNKPTGKKE